MKRRKQPREAAAVSGEHMEKKKKKKKIGAMETMEERMERLQGGRFRWINEVLYTSTGEQAARAFRDEPGLFTAYHEGYSLQVAQWPEDPLDTVIAAVRREEHRNKTTTKLRVADLGCGVARMAAELEAERFTVHSFDLVAANERVTACNIAHVPLPSTTVDVAVFCLSLMGTDHAAFVAEAHRILVPGGLLLVAEPKSRIDSVASFVRGMRLMGFERPTIDESNTMFVLFSFHKTATATPVNIAQATPKLALKPCLYKRR